MKEKELKLLQALHDVVECDENFLNNKQYNVYNKLADKADKANIVW